MAKGAGMLAPGLATMLVVLTTDADLPADALDAALRAATRVTFDRLDSDGCMSTNDTVALLASGASGITPDTRRSSPTRSPRRAQTWRRQLQQDAEGASHDITIEVVNAATEDDAVEVGRAVARSNLFKTAIFGNDPNWGRVLAVGRHHLGRLRPVRHRRDDQRHPGLPGRRAGPAARTGGPHAAGRARAHRPGRRHRARQHPHQRPHPRLRAREQRVRELMADDTWLQRSPRRHRSS